MSEDFSYQVEAATASVIGGVLLRALAANELEITGCLIATLREALKLAEGAYARQVGERTRAAPEQPAEKPTPTRKRGRPASAANKTGNGKVAAAPADAALFPDGEPGL